MPDGFPLPSLFRQLAEDHLAEAERMVHATETDVRNLLVGLPRSATFRPDTDPVTLLIEAAEQRRLCQVTIQLDDEARERAKDN